MPIVTLCLNPAIDKSSSVERVVPDRKLRCAAPHFHAGGGGLNVARVIHRLGGETIAVYPSGGLSGKLLESLMEAEGVPHQPVQIDGYTREDLHIDETSSGQQYRFNMPGPQLTETELFSCLEAAMTASPNPEYLVFSGSLPPGVPPSCVSDLARACKQKGIDLVVDTSGPALREAVRAGVCLIKPNQNELSALLGKDLIGESELFDGARAILDTGGCDIMLISLAAAGVLAVTHDEVIRVAAPPVKAVSRVGAGDSATGATVLKLSQGAPLEEAVRFGVAAGTAAVLGHGTELCKKEDVGRLLAGMR